jgi:RNA polymerase sigma-70 factor (ECF subfamily)
MQGTIEALSDWQHPLSGSDLANASDGVLMLCFRAQVPEAFADAFLRHSGSVERFVRQLGYPSVNAEDIVQDVFERLRRNQGGFDARRGSLAAYLKWQARSRCIDRVRSEISRRNRELVDNEVATTQSFEDEVVSTLSGQCVRTALAGLDDDERVPIELAYMGGLSYCAVADFLELPEGTVKSRIRRGLRNLKASSDLVELMSD